MGFLTKGKEKEKQFATLFENVVYSDSEADITQHWDVKVEFKFDVKGLKRTARNDVYTNEFYHFIELKNVNGKLGWAYGEADYFAFETNEYWIIVAKKDLQEFISLKVVKKKVSEVDECLYCLYSRSGRKDIMTLVKTIDLIYISTELVKKKKGVITHEIGDSIIPEKREKSRLSKILGN